ncbi:unnamed protein product [Cladocopium goreaui]|uniref:Uncharacterized protein n=1 Tax=Cladocopium goreaui TaxID=2562237 RepID=A0A9P1GI84_9DINO|nr:unnamed protein product [Cladocopium goreaui]
MANPKNASFGLVPSTAVRALPAEDRKLFLKSTSQESFAAKRPSVARSCLKCCSQSLGEIHEIGQRRTKNAGIPLPTAELHNRNMCEYTFSYKENPLLGASINRELAESFRDGNRSTKPPLPAFGHVPSRRQMRHARKRMFEPPVDRRAEESLCFGSTKSSETRSASHQGHGSLPLDMVESSPHWTVKDTLGPRLGSGEAFRTTYQVSYKPQTAPADFWKPVLRSQVKFSWLPEEPTLA